MQSVRVYEDLNGQEDWSRVEETFERFRGEDYLDCRVTYFRDGTVEQDDFVGGTLRHRIIQNSSDHPVNDGSKPWNQIQLRYDEQGAELQVLIFFADGSVRNELCHPALWHDHSPKHPAILHGDNKTPDLSAVVVDYLGNGQLQGRSFYYSDLMIIAERYEDGVLSEVLQDMTSGVSVGTTKTDWSSVVQNFDADGRLTRKITVWDNGKESEELFEDAVLEPWYDSSRFGFAMGA